MGYSNNSILKHINKPSKVIFWDLDEALSFIIPFAVLCIASQVFLGIFFGLVVFFIMKFVKQHVGISSISHAAYWYLPTPSGKFKIHIASYRREYIG